MSRIDFVALGFDPTPGDVSGVEAHGARFGASARLLGEAADSLTSIVQGDQSWAGDAAHQFTDCVASTVPLVRDAATAMSDSAETLRKWARALAHLQHRAGWLETAARTAMERVSAAQTNPYLSPLVPVAGENDSQLRTLLAQRELRSALDELEHLRWLARQLEVEHSREAAVAATELDRAAALAPDAPGLFERVGAEFGRILDTLLKAPQFAWEFIRENADTIAFISDTASDLSTALGIASGAFALIPGTQPLAGALGVTSVALSAAAFAGHAVAMRAGAENVTWKTLALDGLGTIPAGRLAAEGLARFSTAPDTFHKQAGGLVDIRQNYLLSLDGNLWAGHWNPRDADEAALAFFQPAEYTMRRAAELAPGK
ncbi:hypothetical protein [Hoyosella subflava]|uniref:Integral membrane protein n=1 Tax=Hoyosella subflava (strain DSM 45089 / JCM 17490 / NBRC 109087 / DQS3-9A1) TaxID=443218 RepID=F6EKU8_HOYSD|nr:hypothetical protein [Hoyosella subflava]AEF41428.1 Integral membrane protein [Hoyosella subflava DQS3-9A1]